MFVWETPHQQAFESTIRELTNPRILAHFNGTSPLRLETDAAQSRGLGMALWQQEPAGEWRLLQCGSRHVTPTEARYSATEIELLAVVWAVQKAHLFLAGAQFELIVDHRPLVPIINTKKLDELTSPRIVRMKEKLATYRISAVWRPGTKHTVVDCLSRHPIDNPTEEDAAGEIEFEQICHVAQLLAATDHDTGEVICEDVKLERIRAEGRLDNDYATPVKKTRAGFPANKQPPTHNHTLLGHAARSDCRG